MQQVIYLGRYGGGLVLQELVGERDVPQPLVAVVALAVALRAAICEVGVEHQAERGVVCPVEHTTVAVYGAVVLRLHGVVGDLHVIVGA